MTKLSAVADGHVETIGGVRYGFRTPTVYDLPKMNWRLTRAQVRRPTTVEYLQAALAGIEAMASIADAPEEGAAQREVIEHWYRLLPEIDENDIEEPDLERRAEIMAERAEERRQAMAALLAPVLAIEANLDRHWQDWAELRADARLWEDYSRIDAARLLLAAIDGEALPRVADGDERGMVTEEAFAAIALAVRPQLGAVALGLLAPTETQRKN